MANQRLELTWIGKGEDPAIEPRILLHDPSKDYGDPNTENMLIHGDNLLALKALEQEYAGQVKCIYIDPPYNTGAAFGHYDDNIEHSSWLNLIKSRLLILWNLLNENSGSIWISIDDYEQAYLRILCDEVFGRKNFIAQIVWQKRYSRENREAIGDAHEYIIVYAKNPAVFKKIRNVVPMSEEQARIYKNPNNDPRGRWRTIPITAQAGHATPNQFYTITTPSGKQFDPPPGNCWRFTEERYNQLVAEGRIYFGKNGDSQPTTIRYLSEVSGVAPWTWWPCDEVGHTDSAKKEIMGIFGKTNIFDTPKPETLIRRIIHIATNPGDLVLDSFLGSGTTAAVAHKMRRRYIGIELGDHCYTHCKPRLDKVIDGEQGGISKEVNWHGGGGYKFYELAPTLIVKDKYGNPVFSEQYSPEMLVAAVAKINGYHYAPDSETFWKQGFCQDNSFIYVTTQYLTGEVLDGIAAEVGAFENLLICAPAFDTGLNKRYENITVRKIPQSVLDKCQYGVDNYNLNIIDPPALDEEEWEDD